MPDSDTTAPAIMKTQPELLHSELDHIIEDCTECGNCVRQCGFLQRFGTPAELAKQFKAGTLAVETIYSCSLCKLCDVFCPEALEPSYLFWLMRCQIVADEKAPLKKHRRILAYEKWGLSDLFHLMTVPPHATSVFFPGCALAGSRPDQLLQVFALLRKQIDNLGIVLHCCAKPSHDLGRTAFFETEFGKLLDTLKKKGIKSIITACPSCHQIFRSYGEGLQVTTLYEVLAGGKVASRSASMTAVSIHDPCSTRFETDVHQSVRTLAEHIGVDVKEMKHRQKRTLCCGEGGSACFVAPAITDLWAKKREEERGNLPVITYCAGCVQFFSERFKTIHIIDLMLNPDQALSGKVKISKTPWTYLNRLILKRRLKNKPSNPGS